MAFKVVIKNNLWNDPDTFFLVFITYLNYSIPK